MRENPITFKPTHTLVLTANDEPPLTDPAVRRRVRLIPCEGDPEAVEITEAALGRRTSDPAWRAEMPGVLAAMMREAAAWLADPGSAASKAGPASIRSRAEEIADEQDPIRRWLEAETEPFEAGTPSTSLYKAFRRSCLELGVPHGRIPTQTKWGAELTERGFPRMRNNVGTRCRPLRLRDGGGWAPLLPNGDAATLPGGPAPSPPAPAQIPAPAAPSTTSHPQNQSATADADVREASPPTLSVQPKKPTSKRASTTKNAKAERRAAALAEIAGERVALPVVVDRAGRIAEIDLATAQTTVAEAVERAGALTVDVETTGYPVGHRDYALRTVQLGDAEAAVVFDATEPHTDVVRHLLAAAPKLHAHSATADLVPLAAASLCEEPAWDRMHDTVIPAKLADPASTGSDPGLKKLASAVLGEQATTPAADAARATLFKTGRWLTDTKVTTPVERSGWAQVDPRAPRWCATPPPTCSTPRHSPACSPRPTRPWWSANAPYSG